MMERDISVAGGEELPQEDQVPSTPTAMQQPIQSQLSTDGKRFSRDKKRPVRLEFSNLASIKDPIELPFMSEIESEPQPANENGLGEGSKNSESPANNANSGHRMSIPRVPVGRRASWTPSSPSMSHQSATSGTLVSPVTPKSPFLPKVSKPSPRLSPRASFPDWNKKGTQGYLELNNLDDRIGEAEEQEIINKSTPDPPEEGPGSSSSAIHDNPMNKNDSSTTILPRVESYMGDGYHIKYLLPGGCPPNHDIYHRKTSWLSLSIFFLSIYSTVFSGIWIFVAIVQPRYGRRIDSNGSLTPSVASTLFALFAKTIELSFVTVFVAFLGQVLSRRSLSRTSRGMSLAEMNMRTWVIQPGHMISHWETWVHVRFTILGTLTFLAAIVAMLYTTASDSLVSPHLRYGHWENKLMQGLVQTSYANVDFAKTNCQTPISATVDPDNSGLTCLGIENAGESYHDFLAYMNTWAGINSAGVGNSTDLSQRPPATGTLYDNTTVTGSWVLTNTSNITAAFQQHKRIVNNVTLAMPHAGVFAAAHDTVNGILQPADLDGVGEYMLRASVVSPALNVLCINMNENELMPLIPSTSNGSFPGQNVGADANLTATSGGYIGPTVVDDLFGWGPKYSRQLPTFPKLPDEYNSVINDSVAYDEAIYILFNASTPEYSLCQLRSYLSPACSTQYNVSGMAGGYLASHCEDPNDDMAYLRSVPDAPTDRSTDWRNLAQEWALAMSMNGGISDSNTSTARLLSELVLTAPAVDPPKLDPILPSIAEALAVLCGSTLLLGSTSAGFYHYWGYPSPKLDPGTYQQFNASISSQQYSSGPTQPWQGIFYIVLLVVFITNIFCLVYFIGWRRLVTDFTEAHNMFGLAVNSPPSEKLRGSCGGGPETHQLGIDWHVDMEDSGHYYFTDSNDHRNRESGIFGGDMLRSHAWRRNGSWRAWLGMGKYSRLNSKKKNVL